MADRKLKAAKGAFDASIDCGITFFDTAEVYGAGISGAINSESLLGRYVLYCCFPTITYPKLKFELYLF